MSESRRVFDIGRTEVDNRASSGRISVGMAAQCGGVLAGVQLDDFRCCVWVEDRGRRIPVRWPAGLKARPGPLELIDSQGHVVAAEGMLVVRVGGFADALPSEPCALGQKLIFAASSVTAIGEG